MPRRIERGAIRAESKSLVEVLHSGFFHVPRYQRLYDWRKREVGDFLMDLEMCIDDGHNEHFFGTILLKSPQTDRGNIFEINDGQQRMITFSLVCAWMSRFFQGVGDSYEDLMVRALFKRESYQQSKLEEARDYSPRIIVSEVDKEYYEAFIRGESIGESQNISVAWKSINNVLDKRRSDEKWMKKLAKFLLEKIKVVVVYVPYEVDANTIFEVLNARGKPLKQIDLLRSYFYSNFRDREEIGSQGEEIMEKLHILFHNRGEKTFENYVRCHAQVLYGHLSATRFYRDIRRQIEAQKVDKADHIFSFINQLKVRAWVYNTIKTPPRSKEWIEADDGTRLLEKIKRDAKKFNSKRDMFNFMWDVEKYSVAHPVAFALLSRYFDLVRLEGRGKKMDARFIFVCSKLLASFVQRCSHCFRPFKPSLYEERMSGLAKSVFHRTCNTPNEFLEKLKGCDEKNVTPIIPNDSYIDMMRAVTFSKKLTDQPRYILANIGEYETVGTQIRDCQIEHVLPKSPKHWEGWQGFNEDQGERYVNRLGNMTLLASGKDSSSNKANVSFSRKKKTYGGSSYKITSDLCEIDEWSPEEIDRRQEKLARLAAKVWNFDL